VSEEDIVASPIRSGNICFTQRAEFTLHLRVRLEPGDGAAVGLGRQPGAAPASGLAPANLLA
jgi:hypothetical protein